MDINKSTLDQVEAMTWANVDQNVCRCMVSLGHNELRFNTVPHNSSGTGAPLTNMV